MVTIKLGEPIPEEEHLIQTQINIEVDLLSSKHESKIGIDKEEFLEYL